MHEQVIITEAIDAYARQRVREALEVQRAAYEIDVINGEAWAERAREAEKDATRWRLYSRSPQTALALGSLLDPHDSSVDWTTECNRLADGIIAVVRQQDGEVAARRALEP